MASTKEFKVRIKSITSIQKITRAMKMVAASKLRMVQKNLEQMKPHFIAVNGVVDRINQCSDIDRKNSLIIPISSDRGLCGGINTNLVKLTKGVVNRSTSNDDSIKILPLGEKGKDALQRSHGKYIDRAYTELTKKSINFSTASVVAEEMLSNDFGSYTFLYSEFKSAITQSPVENVLPNRNSFLIGSESINEFETEEDKMDVMNNLYEYYVSLKVLYFLLENATSEQGARMNAMDSASRNASEIIDKLTLIYNKARQAAITGELIEIISCASAVSK